MIFSFFSEMARHPKARLGFILLGLLFLSVYSSPWWSGDPIEMIGQPHQFPNTEFLLGTNGQGQDVLAQCFRGAIASLTTAMIVGLLVTAIGSIVGISSALIGGYFDHGVLLAINLFLLIPGLPLAILLAAYLPTGPVTIGFVLVITGWAWNARVIRSQALSIRKRDFVAAALSSGESPLRIVIFEILPNMSSIITSILIGSTIYAIGAQVGLEFLGLGDVSQVSWGTILYWASNDSALLTGSWWMYVPAGVLIALVGFSLTLINFGIDEIANPRLRDQDEFVNELKKRDMTYTGITPVLQS